MANNKLLLNDGSSFVLLNDGTNQNTRYKKYDYRKDSSCYQHPELAGKEI